MNEISTVVSKILPAKARKITYVACVAVGTVLFILGKFTESEINLWLTNIGLVLGVSGNMLAVANKPNVINPVKGE